MSSWIITSGRVSGARIFLISVLCFPATTFSWELSRLVTAFAMSFIEITSPAWNEPATETIPLGRSAFLFLIAFTAPGSMFIVPAGRLLIIQRWRLLSFLFGMNTVPMFLPSIIFVITAGVLPLARTIRQPAFEAICAASIFVFIPPVAWVEPEPPEFLIISGVIS